MTPQPDNLDYNGNDVGENEDDADITNHPYVRRLQSELAEKMNMLRAQSMEINRLQNVLRNIPAQTIYGITPNMMSPPASIQRPGGHMLQRNGSSPMV